MTREELELLWNDPRHWKWGVYYCKEDPRAIVPKRWKWMGWTINAARPSAIPVLLLLILSCLLAPIYLAQLSGAEPVTVFLAVGIGIIALCGICAWLASRTS
jgi:hypothetical protein